MITHATFVSFKICEKHGLLGMNITMINEANIICNQDMASSCTENVHLWCSWWSVLEEGELFKSYSFMKVIDDMSDPIWVCMQLR